MKKRILIIVSLVILIMISFSLFKYIRNVINADIVRNLKGEIYYTKRVDGVLVLFKSDADLKNEKLIYSHKGKGKDSYVGYNDNIIDFHYEKENDTITFVAMNDGNWSLFSLKEGDKSATVIKSLEDEKGKVMMSNTEYIKNETENLTAIQRKGSIYIIKDGKEKCIKKFYGIYDFKFTGYNPIGFSPDGKYLIYRSMEHLTPIGTLIEGAISGSCGNTYIMDISTGKSARYIDVYNIQWVMNEKTN